jgi:hypothetical protein
MARLTRLKLGEFRSVEIQASESDGYGGRRSEVIPLKNIYLVAFSSSL